MKINYRPEIDGLRAIAILSVVFYHAKISIFGNQIFSGGFLGVDIFFVISGYLITSIILKELKETGKFSFSLFYQRRIRRIIPALVFLMLFCIPFAWFILTPASFEDFSKSIIYSLGFTSNFYFWHTGLQYGTESGFLKPFLHTWSLSVEEQYYIIFPLLFFIFFKFLKNYLNYILIIGFIISLFLAEWGSRNYPSFNFYVLPTRGWELLAGSILSYSELKFSKFNKNKILNEIFLVIGIFLIIFPIIYFNDEMSHPSFYTLIPVLGVCLIINFSRNKEFITKLLSNKFMVSIGLISYSLYLWHFPILAFDRILEFTLDNTTKNILLWVFIILISIFSYLFIEKPFRNKNFTFKRLSIPILIAITLTLTFNLGTIYSKGYESRIPEILKESNFNEMYSQKNIKKRCNFNKIKNANFCSVGQSNNKVYLVGDSHMVPLARNLGEQLVNNNYSLILLYQETQIFFREGMIEKRYDFLKGIKNSVIIFGGFMHRENKNNLQKMEPNYQKTFEKLLKNGNKIILIYPIPSVKFKYDMNLIRFYEEKGYLENQFLDKKAFVDKSRDAYTFYDKLLYGKIKRIYPEKYMCDEKKCYSVRDNVILISDIDHPSSHLSKKINEEIISLIKN